MSRHKQTGYTLIEIIVGILVAMAVVMAAMAALQKQRYISDLDQLAEGLPQIRDGVTALYQVVGVYDTGAINPASMDDAGLTPVEWSVVGSGLLSQWATPVGGTQISMALNNVSQIELTVRTSAESCPRIADRLYNMVFEMLINGVVVKGSGATPSVSSIGTACGRYSPPRIILKMYR